MASFILLIITEFLFLVFAVLGYTIRIKKRVDVIAGYQKGTIRDPDGLSRWVGNNLFFLAGCSLAAMVGILVFPDQEVVIFMVLITLVPIVSVITALRSKRFEQPPEKKK
ncbi:Flp pilus assembly protein TadB [Methanolinea mesophila]|uniref:DUF3784 domain-containing protein n=1 Tax=Methanolinea mesophila TaxID=547055 RepID=UPI001AE7A316|nr:DUF3784 domain-containing protein [Methanolinea mesophila]MBP1928844.1 Flp pilus assembly protein TadB [Methanolinea mesophila]